jgi:two-component system, OmpR family, response regulator ChvI
MFLTKRKLLLVDDEKDLTSLLFTILRKSGYEVVFFNDPLMALERFKPRYYDLMILDIRMPKMNGFELYRQIRRMDNRVKVCFLTAIGEFKEYEQYRKEVYPKLGERHFITKPVSNQELIGRINEMLTPNGMFKA